MKRKVPQVTARLSEELIGRLDSACTRTGLDTSTVVKACVTAFVEEVERTGEIRLPLAIVPKAKKTRPAEDCPPAAAGGRSSSSTAVGHRYQEGRERFKGAGEEDIGLAGERPGSSKKFSPGSE